MTTAEIIDTQAEIIEKQEAMIQAMAIQLDTVESWDREIKNIEALKNRLEDGKGEP